MHFPVSGVDCPIWLPPAVGFLVALLATPAGISGAFLLLPFQISALGFVSPAVTPTNLLFNVVAVPGGVGRYIKEHRMVWPLAWVICAGTLPGIILGAVIRVRYLLDPRYCKLFVGGVLLYLGARLVQDGVRPCALGKSSHGMAARRIFASTRRIEFEFDGRTYQLAPATLAAVALLVGAVGGIYGVGGGAMIAPFAMTILRLPAGAVAGAALFGTLITSLVGVVIFEVLAASAIAPDAGVRPDWALGLLFGVGGLLGSYLGARLQKRLPERWIRLSLGLLMTAMALAYGAQFFMTGSRT